MSRQSVRFVVLIVFFIFTSCLLANAAETQAARPDIIIKISRLNEALNIIDRMAAADMGKPTSAPSYLLRSALFGTDWIDPSRAIVIGINFKNMQKGAQPEMAALIPYVRQNEDFQIAYNGVSKIDHCLISLPPGQGGTVSNEMDYALDEASMKKPEAMISIELAANQMLKKAAPQIKKMLLDMDAQMKKQSPSGTELKPEDVTALMKGLINAAKQLDTVSIGMNLTDTELTILSDAVAQNGTDLSKLFTRTEDSHTSVMGNYNPQLPIQFKAVSYDMKGMLAFFNKIFGGVYKKIGLDLTGFENVADHFTGEMAGGISLADSGMDMEMISLLTDTKPSGADFLESVYIPAIMDYGKKLAAVYNQNTPGAKINNFFTKTPETAVDGKKVFGISCEIPLNVPGRTKTGKFKFNLRSTVTGKLLLTASTDDRLKELIKIGGTLRPQPYDGPLMKMDIDLGTPLNAVSKMIPQTTPGKEMNFSNLGKIVYTLDMQNGELSNKYSIPVADIRSMATSIRGAVAGGMHENAEPPFSQTAPTMLQQSEEEHPMTKPQKEDTAGFWVDKGLLYATYGNDKEAIEFYKKALKIDPNNTRALFNIGISYSSLGDFDMAIASLKQALSLEPDNGDYNYGLGWVYLLKGEAGKGMEYIQTAADLGNPDARKYLMNNKPEGK